VLRVQELFFDQNASSDLHVKNVVAPELGQIEQQQVVTRNNFSQPQERLSGDHCHRFDFWDRGNTINLSFTAGKINFAEATLCSNSSSVEETVIRYF